MIGWPTCWIGWPKRSLGRGETAINGVVLRVYDLDSPAQPIRIDSTSAKTYAGVDENGLFQTGS